MKQKGKLLQIAQLGNPVLRTKSKPVQNIHDPEIQTLIADLLATLKASGGVGIAAPQVYAPYRIIIVASKPTPRYPKAPRMKPTVMINPELITNSKFTVEAWEGCMSIPGIRGLVPRFKNIKVKYIDLKGKEVSKTYKDFIARIFQHELDHLDGVLFIDRVTSSHKLISDSEYQKLLLKK